MRVLTCVPLPPDPQMMVESLETTFMSLVATTADSSAAGVELSSDDFRQPAGITDENSFFIFLWREPIFGKKIFFS